MSSAMATSTCGCPGCTNAAARGSLCSTCEAAGCTPDKRRCEPYPDGGDIRDAALHAIENAGEDQLVIIDQAASEVRTMDRGLDPQPTPPAIDPPIVDPDMSSIFEGTPLKPPQIDPPAPRRETATLAFDEAHVAPILAREKTATLRLPGEYDQAVVHAAERGSEVVFTTADGEAFARGQMTARWAATARQVAGSSLAGYPADLDSPDDVLRTLERHYGEELIDAEPTQAVDVLHFDVAERVRTATIGGEST